MEHDKENLEGTRGGGGGKRDVLEPPVRRDMSHMAHRSTGSQVASGRDTSASIVTEGKAGLQVR